ncbi:hypothetical protein NHX12_025525 [Muraenolepis orangiensis]|uniref:Transposase n=1 Tax=Muraenolepis orangiensis TaxID=630683 RepID=A0A9Q0EMW6_9TELE|nr:hypothetical protein NHX12_025525 [Muraenolepis orangiensis]
MVEALAQNTNEYSFQERGTSVNTTAKEIEKMLGMYLKMGLVQMAGTLSETEKKDKLWKLRLWLDSFREKCLQVVPEEHNSVDEMMIPFKGKFSSIKQYMRGKPNPWGFKVWVRTGISGMMCDFDVYQGSVNGIRAKSELGLSVDKVDLKYIPGVSIRDFELEVADLKVSDMWVSTEMRKLQPEEQLILTTWNELPVTYHTMQRVSIAILTMFGSTYACEQTFSHLRNIKTNLRSCLTDGSLNACMKLNLLA